ncbi:MAG TPA: hypothetical protein VK611_27835 [Acidimicrobiales bacterium]|nr:hypothetical protein [Acidimicrobiales bacterium]
MTDAAGDVAADDAAGAKVPSPARTALLVVGLVAVAGGIPLAMALGVLHQPRWYPLLDLAQTELRVRDVGTGDSPLVGLAGRINGDDGLQGSHPGPLSFWSLAPFYTLFGRTAWALQAAAASLNLLAMGVAVWIAHRRGGPYAALGATVVLAVLMRAYAADWLTEAWNPYMPMLWWVVFLLAVWSVLCDDLALLPVAVFAGSFCGQTHIPYLGLVVGVGGLTAALLAWRLVSRRSDPGPDAGSRRKLLRYVLPSLGLLVVLWLPPVIQEVTSDRGNLTLIQENFTRESNEEVGVRRAAEVVMSNLSVTNLLESHKGSRDAVSGGLVNAPALALLAVWGAAVWLAWRRGYRDLLNLHALVAVALVLGVVSISRIFDLLWYYLVLWLWGTVALALLASAWTFVRAWPRPRAELTRFGTAGLVVVLVAVTAKFTYDSAFVEPPAAEESAVLAEVTPELVAELRSGDLPGGGEDGRYLVRWGEDALAIGSQGFGFLLELERQGFDVGVVQAHATGAVEHRVRSLDDASATINYVIGEQHIERWRAVPGAVEAVHYEPRDDAEQRRFDDLRAEVADGLEDRGLGDLADRLDENLFRVGIDPRTPPEISTEISALMDLGLPTAVFVAPPDAG